MEDIDYLSDSRFGDKRELESLANAARIIVKDYCELIDYIEPTDDNKNTYSHRLYELLLRTATEFEANCKGIMKANGYKNPRNICDFHLLNSKMKLSEYEIVSRLWKPEKVVKPFVEWKDGHTLSWYQSYNLTKHNRFENFEYATLENVFMGVSCLIVILAAQSPIVAGEIFDNTICTTDTQNEIILENVTVRYPKLGDNDAYDFDWDVLKTEEVPFDNCDFSDGL